eukprot:Colp12_sorted_trinity150504_noHs@3055
MASFEIIKLDLTAEHAQVKNVLSSLLHTILFNRAFGTLVRPVEVDCEHIDVTYVRLDNAEVQRAVEEKVNQFVAHLVSGETCRGQINLAFHEKKAKGWFGGTEQVCFEQWEVTVTVVPATSEAKRAARREQLERDVRGALQRVCEVVTTQWAHVPAVTSADLFPYPYKITIPRANESWTFESIKRILLDSGPPLVV